MEDNEPTEQTIKEALSYRAKKHGGPTTQQWSKIMEETNNNQRANNRNKLLAVAASVLAVAVLSSVLIAVNQSNETQSTNKGERVSTSTTTTTPLTAEQALLKDTIILKEVNQRTGDNGEQLYDLQAVDGLTGKVDAELTKLINDQKLFNPIITDISKGSFRLTDGVSPSCDEYTTHIFNLNEKTVTQSQGFANQYGISPKGEQSAFSGPETCIDNSDEDSLLELSIRNIKSGKVRTIKPENYKFEAGDGTSINAKVYVADFVWVDENTAVVGIVITATNGIDYHIVDLSKPVSLVSLVGKTPISGGSDGFPIVTSAARIDGQVYLLMQQGDGDTGKLFARTLENEAELWSTDYSGPSYGQFSFGSTPEVIYGTKDGRSFIYDGKSNKILTPEGVAIIRK